MISDRLIEKVHAGEASEAERARVLADPAARARLEALPALDRAFHEAHPADVMVPKIEARARVAAAKDDVARRWAAIGGMALIPLVAAAVALVLVGDPSGAGGPGTGVEQTTAKGPLTAKLRVYRLRSKGPERIAPGTVARAGDRVQLGVIPGNATSAVVVSIDGRGEVTLHFPPDAGGSTALADGETPVPQAYELDDAPDYERFFLVADDEPVSIETVLAAAEELAKQGDPKAAPLPLPPGLGQHSFLLRKEPR